MRETLYEVAKNYIILIEKLEKANVKATLAELEEQRVIWHNKLIQILKQEGIPYLDREHVTRLAYQIVKGHE